MAHGRKTRTRARTRGANRRHAGRHRAVRAHGREGAPGRVKVERAEKVKSHGRGTHGASPRAPKVKVTPRATRPAKTRSSVPRVPRVVKVVPVAPRPSTPKVKPVKVKPVAPVAPTVVPEPVAPTGSGNAYGKSK